MNRNVNRDISGNPILDIADLREEFFILARQAITRSGIEDLLEWLDTTDFFYAPCSTIYHLSCPGGLVAHSIAVYEDLIQLLKANGMYTIEHEEKYAICALFHDLCKVHTYTPAVKSRKTGQKNQWGKWIWEDFDGYDFVEEFPFGHGEKSVYLISQYLHLSPEEAIAIRWHMGAYDNAAKSDPRTLSNAQQMFPFAVMLHCADAISTAKGW